MVRTIKLKTLMKTDHVLYTDGHDVTVTDSVLQVRRKGYILDGVTKHGFSILQPDRLPSVMLLIAGVLFAITGATQLIPSDVIPDANLGSAWITVNQMAVGFGIFLIVMGAFWWFLTKERYAVSITTAEGERNVVISERKEYITQIVHALNEAFFTRVHGPGLESRGSGKNFMVSGR